ncbi:STAS domain-containing protein [Eubacteriaceae bacterium ES2]|nr:STAS domain-containing protein [Eubacteriaceae bacterium ES2]
MKERYFYNHRLHKRLTEDLSDFVLEEIKKQIFEKVNGENIKELIFDFEDVNVMDSFTYNSLDRITSELKLMGVEVVWVGLKPCLIAGLIELEVEINPLIHVEKNLNMGNLYLDQIGNERNKHARSQRGKSS